MNLFQAAARGLPLSPASRALLKLLKGLIVSAVLAGLTAAYPLVVVGPGAAPNVSQAMTVFLVAFLAALVNATEKYLTAEPLPQAAPLMTFIPGVTVPTNTAAAPAMPGGSFTIVSSTTPETYNIGTGALAKGDGS